MSRSSATRAWIAPRDMPLISRPKAMFCATVIQGNRAYSWNTMPRSGPGAATVRPSTSMPPRVGCEKPAMALSSVDFPQPDGPSRQTNSPRLMVKSMSLRATTSPPGTGKILSTPETTMCGEAWDGAAEVTGGATGTAS